MSLFLRILQKIFFIECVEEFVRIEEISRPFEEQTVEETITVEKVIQPSEKRPEFAELDYIQPTPAEATPQPERAEVDYYAPGPEQQPQTVYEATMTAPAEEKISETTTTRVEVVTELSRQEMPEVTEKVISREK